MHAAAASASIATCAAHAAALAASAVPPASSSEPSTWVRAWVAIGGNSGHRARNLSIALRLLQRTPGVRLTRTSFLYETSPVGSPKEHLDQARFLNGVVEVRTRLAPLELLNALQRVETLCGRTRDASGIRNGPRPVDLDILFYRDTGVTIEHDRLQVPHPRWNVRGFVLAPLRDLLVADYSLDSNASAEDVAWRLEARQSVERAWAAWGAGQASGSSTEREVIRRVIPFPTADAVPDSDSPAISDVWRWGPPIRAPGQENIDEESFATDASTPYPRPIAAPTHIMGILNLTPDSFSDGGGAQTTSVEAAVAAAKSLWDAGADIIDIGGESTRPGAVALTADEEAARILPAIRAIRATHPHIKMSVDTYHPRVARLAVAAGVDMINDVCGGTVREPRDPNNSSAGSESMLDVAAELNVPYVCMHIRGTTQTMTRAENNEYAHLLQEVRLEQEAQFRDALDTRVDIAREDETNEDDTVDLDSAAAAASSASSSLAASPFPAPSSVLYSWNLISDPGIGFAKSGAHAMHVLRHLPAVRPFDAFPILVGTSRKGFISQALRRGRESAEARHQRPNDNAHSTAAAPAPLPLVDRAWGTSATTTASIAGGADIVRVHDVHETRCVRDIADQIYPK